MNKSTAFAAVALLAAASASSLAADWRMVAGNASGQTFIDRDSFAAETPSVATVQVLENFSATQTLGDPVYPHMSRYTTLAVDCANAAVAYANWDLKAGHLGSGKTVWADDMQGGRAFFRPEAGSGYDRVVQSVCNGNVAQLR